MLAEASAAYEAAKGQKDKKVLADAEGAYNKAVANKESNDIAVDQLNRILNLTPLDKEALHSLPRGAGILPLIGNLLLIFI